MPPEDESRPGHGRHPLTRRTADPQHDPLPEALGLAQGAADAGLGLKLLGGLAVRVLCPDFPPRLRRGQDMDFACLSKGRKNVVAYLETQRLRAGPPVQQPERRPADVLQRARPGGPSTSWWTG